MDTRDLAAQLAQAEAQTLQAQHTITQSQSQLVQQGSQMKLAAQELQRARALVRQDFESREVLDQRQSQFDSATAAYHASEAQIVAATAAMQAAIHNADVIRTDRDRRQVRRRAL
jgi:HlyD family secretion protein